MATATGTTQKARSGKSTAAILLTFLGSMNLAITLLVAVAIASVIGTVLQQDQTYSDYELKFGPFWFHVFEVLGLYDVYRAPWFLGILAFLVISTSVCLIRHLPTMWKEMTRFREHQQERSLRALSTRQEWRVAVDEATVAERVGAVLRRNGFRVRHKQKGDARLVSAMTGWTNRMGYILTHLSIVVICVGALIDGNLGLQIKHWMGDVQVETRDIPVSQIDERARLPVSNGAMRGNVTIPEGGRAGVVFLDLREGYVVQDLPFRLEVEEFRVEHYDTGEPRSFESDVILTAPDLDEPIEETIRVNHPLVYDGYAIYQSDFGDGGSQLELRAWPLDGGDRRSFESEVFDEEPLGNESGYVAEFHDFEAFNIHPVPDSVSGEREMRNVGPSFTFRLRRPTGEALEYENYMMPVDIDGVSYYMSGVRRSEADDFRYLYVPADPEGSLDRFMSLLQSLRSSSTVERAAEQALTDIGVPDEELRQRVAGEAYDMVQTLLDEGFEAVQTEQQARADAADGAPDRLLDFYRMVLERTLWQIYVDVLQEGGAEGQPEDADLDFYRHAMQALTALADYDAPVFLELTGFEQRQATGLQIARAPGQNIVYFGFVLLTVGLILLFYVAHRRIWCWIRPDGDRTLVLLAATSQRDPLGFTKLFAALRDEVSWRLEAEPEEANDDQSPTAERSGDGQ